MQDTPAHSAPRDEDPRRFKIHRRPPERDVPYVPTADDVAAAMLRFANVNASDTVYDLGCGDGRIVIAAARLFGARGVGIDVDPKRIAECLENARHARVMDRVRFLCKSFFDISFADASAIMLYLLPITNRKLRPRLLAELKPGTRIVANNYGIPEWPPDLQTTINGRILHQWIVPAWIGGQWRCMIDAPGQRQKMFLRLHRHYQTVTGEAHLPDGQVPISAAKLTGRHFTFKLIDPHYRRPIRIFEAQVQGDHLRGHCRLQGPDSPPTPWFATRKI